MKEPAPSISKLEAIRNREHRLKPSRRLKSKAEIVKFIHTKGLVSALGGNELPSFISAILGKSWKPSAKGFTGWLDWWSLKISGQRVAHVSGEIERMDDIVATRIFRRTKTFVSNNLWPIIEPIVEHQNHNAATGKNFSPLELELLRTIREEERIRTDKLRKILNLEGSGKTAGFHRSLASLESYSMIVGAEDPHPEKHLHANIWQTWENRTRTSKNSPDLSYEDAVARLLEKTIDSCVLAREDQIRKWFRWSADTETAKEKLLKSGKIARVGSYLISSQRT